MTGCMVDMNTDKWTPGTAYQVDLCKEPAVYRAWIAGCNLCWLCDLPECAGHRVCVRHGAELRTESEALKDRGKPADLVRICSLKPADATPGDTP
jgi:hypothetical protein